MNLSSVLPYLSDKQRNQLLVQHLRGEAKRAVKEYTNDPRGYPQSLKKLKYLFGQRTTVARAVISKVMKGKPVGNKDTKGLAELYYSISHCLVTLSQLNYVGDLYSSDTLYQAVQRLPPYLVTKWSERSLIIRKQKMEPNLQHFEMWLKDRLLAQKEVHGLGQTIAKKSPSEEFLVGVHMEGDKGCNVCDGPHSLWKCMKYTGTRVEE